MLFSRCRAAAFEEKAMRSRMACDRFQLLRRLLLEQSHYIVDRILWVDIAFAVQSIFQKPACHALHVRHEFRVGSGSRDEDWNSAHSADIGIQFEREFVRRTHHAGAGDYADRGYREIDVVDASAVWGHAKIGAQILNNRVVAGGTSLARQR